MSLGRIKKPYRMNPKADKRDKHRREVAEMSSDEKTKMILKLENQKRQQREQHLQECARMQRLYEAKLRMLSDENKNLRARITRLQGNNRDQDKQNTNQFGAHTIHSML